MGDRAPESTSGKRTRSRAPGHSQSPDACPHFLVVDGRSSSTFPLPRDGVVLIGRDQEAALRCDDASVSRKHARVNVADGEARVTDLGSHNGTLVNGERAGSTVALRPGDVVMIGDVLLVLYGSAHAAGERALLDARALEQRLAAEVERTLEYRRPLGVVSIASGPPLQGPAAARALGPHLRSIDLAGRWSDGHLTVVLPEMHAAALARSAARLLEAILPAAPGARAGYSACPGDAYDAGALLGAARAAAAVAAPGEAVPASRGVKRLEMKDRAVVLADAAMIGLYELIRRLAASDLPVLVTGETGAGKENAAWALHHFSPRSRGPFVSLNCAAIPESLVESELFGHVRGAFSGAVGAKRGLLEAAAGGTVFLDEAGEISAAVQGKLLRALENHRITPVGSVEERSIDIRVVAATNRDLKAEVAAGRFRQDLYFRLGAATVVLPPLRDRPREITLLATLFLEDACERMGRATPQLSTGVMRALLACPWPGNVRELKNLMDFVAAAVPEDVVEPWHLPSGYAPPAGEAASPSAATERASVPAGEIDRPAPSRRFRPLAEEVAELERRRMQEALEATGGVQTRAAELIGMPLRTFVTRLRQFGLSTRRGPKDAG